MFNNIPPNGFPQIPDIEDLEAVVEDVKTLKTTAAVHAVAITGLENNKDDTTNIAPTFSADSNYSVGDLVYYEGTLYECTTAHEAAAWDAEDFTAATIAGEINGLNSKLTAMGGATDLGNVQGSDTITLNDAITNYRFVQVLIGYYASGYPCFGQALLPVATIIKSADDIPVTIAFTDRNGVTTGKADVSFLSATSAKVVNTSSTVYTKFMGIA